MRRVFSCHRHSRIPSRYPLPPHSYEVAGVDCRSGMKLIVAGITSSLTKSAASGRRFTVGQCQGFGFHYNPQLLLPVKRWCHQMDQPKSDTNRQVVSFWIPRAFFRFKKPLSSGQTFKITARSGISFGSHLQNAECEPQIFYPSVSGEIMSRASGQCLPVDFSKWRLVYLVDAEWLVHQRRIYYFSL